MPQLFLGSGATKFIDPKQFPWTIGWLPTYQSEAHVYAKYILANKPNGKVAILYQNDDYGKDFLKGMKDGLGESAAKMIVIEERYEVSEPTIDSHIVTLKSSGADVFFDVTTPKFTAQVIKRMAEVGWKPLHVLNTAGASIATLRAAGLENSKDLVSANYLMDWADPQWKDNAAMKEWAEFMDKWNPGGDKTDNWNQQSYNVARTLVQVLKQCGDDLTRANVMRQAANLKDFAPGTLLPGILINTSPTNFHAIRQLQMTKFDGEGWNLFGPVVSSEVSE
jgi:ABC-type branched-subunit amino acid transport system substrate-binding protein